MVFRVGEKSKAIWSQLIVFYVCWVVLSRFLNDEEQQWKVFIYFGEHKNDTPDWMNPARILFNGFEFSLNSSKQL
jgi:hypothetical protein